tara:strand:+ start:500 stop:700 length:201 start_codon:yes stop_codon:yes gene_type:complete
MFVLINLMVVIGALNAIKMYKVNYLKPKKKGYAKHSASFMKIEDAIFWEQHVMKNLKAVDTTITVH